MKFLAVLTVAMASILSVEAAAIGIFAGLFTGTRRCNFIVHAPNVPAINDCPFYYNSDGGITIGVGERLLFGHYDVEGSISIHLPSVWEILAGVEGLVIDAGRLVFGLVGDIVHLVVDVEKNLIVDGSKECYACEENGVYTVFWKEEGSCANPISVSVEVKDC